MKRVLMVLVMMARVALADDPYDAKRAFAAKFDEKSLEVIRRAKTIELIRLKNDEKSEGRTARGDGGVESLAEYAVGRRVVITDSQAVARIKTLTLNPFAYRWYGGTKLCGGFQPKVVLRFGEDSLDSVDVFLCFNCGDIALRAYGKPDIGPLNDRFADMPTEDWLRLVQSLLSDDEFIQKATLAKFPKKEPPPWSPDGGTF